MRGSLSKELIKTTIDTNIGDISDCFAGAQSGWPGASGRLSVKFIIGGDGRIVVASIAKDEVGVAPLACCAVRAVRDWQFPRPEGGGVVVVTYPFDLGPE